MPRKASAVLLGATLLVATAFFVPERAEAVVLHGTFIDTGGSIHVNGIEALAEAGITRGCNPPANDRFCPDRTLTRGEMAAFFSRALALPATNTDHFVDDNGHIFEGDINRLAEAGITRGCNPPANDRFCPDRSVTRAETATFFTRALNLPVPLLKLPLANDTLLSCSKDGRTCTVLFEVNRHRRHLIEEGWYQALPYGPGEEAEFTAANTTFLATLGGEALSLTAHPVSTGSSQATRTWSRTQTFSAGSHLLIAEWWWNGTLVRRVTATIGSS